MRKAAEKYPSIIENTADSIAPVKSLLCSIFQRLQWKEKKVECCSSATLIEIQEMWETLRLMDSTISSDEKWVKKNLGAHAKVKEFIDHCCQQRHYSFYIKKCYLQATSSSSRCVWWTEVLAWSYVRRWWALQEFSRYIWNWNEWRPPITPEAPSSSQDTAISCKCSACLQHQYNDAVWRVRCGASCIPNTSSLHKKIRN